MLAWVMNMGFAASPANTVTVTNSYPAPFGMGLGDELWMVCLLIWIAVRFG